tara:strand:- start:827 stop:988 length:162 start_codon:yes stop_codon:yes gene_type:complete
MSGKGSRPRPMKEKEAYSKSWDAIFGKKDKPEEAVEPSGLLKGEDKDAEDKDN